MLITVEQGNWEIRKGRLKRPIIHMPETGLYPDKRALRLEKNSCVSGHPGK